MARLKHLPNFLIGFLILATLTSCQGFKYTPRQTTDGVYHTVEEGQTLYDIAKAYNLTVETLKQANSVEDETKLSIGTRLWIPGAKSLAAVGDGDAPRKAKRGALAWPVDGGIITSRFGPRNGRNHDGIDIGAKEGTPILAAADGKVVFNGWMHGYGRMLIVKHANHLTTVYAHNSKNSVKKNSRVKRGQVIGEVGQTGRSTGPHLHFEVRNDTHPKNPLLYLP